MIKDRKLQRMAEISREEILSEFAKELPHIRKRLGLSQSDLGNAVGLSRQSISSIERKNVPLTWNTMLAIFMVVIVNDNTLKEELRNDARFCSIWDSVRNDS